MADCSTRSTRWIKTCILSIIVVSGGFAPVSSAQCVDGTYEYDGRDCCLCPAGQHLVEHCTKNLQNGKCELCPDETYSSEPTSETSCEPCTSCSHANDNLEEEDSCTAARNRKCRCRQDHYCSSRICQHCDPCTKCDPEGIKVPCSANNDTVCNDKTTGGDATGKIVGAVVGVAAVLILVGVFLYFWKKKQRQQVMITSTKSTNTNDEATQPLREGKLHLCLPDIAGIIGWRVMRDIAMSTNITSVTIDSIKLNHPGDSQEQTLQLLTHFHEKHSQEAPRMLIENLKRKGKNNKARKVQHLLTSPAGVVESA